MATMHHATGPWFKSARPIPILFSLLLSIVTSTSAPTQSRAEEQITTHSVSTIGLQEVRHGSLLFRTDQAGRFLPAPILKTDVEITVTGLIARATVRQEFRNPSREKDAWVEGIYVFPLPETAAVDHLRMHVGDRVIEGQIKERGEAKQTYERAKKEGKRTSLIEQERPNMFTTSVANIGPGETITVEIQYQETVRYDQGRFSLRFPMVVGHRYIPGTPVLVEGQGPLGTGVTLDTDRVPDASRITPPVHAPGHGPMNPVTLSVTLAPGFRIDKVESPYHPIIVLPDPDGRRLVTLREEAVPAERDFELAWSSAATTGPSATLFTEQRDGETYALLMLMPPTQPEASVSRSPRDLTFIIDTSGSMAGTSIEQAKASLSLALSRLTTQDRFNVIQFNNVVRSLFPGLEPVTPDSMKKAVRYAEHLVADGGTEILPAVRQALKSHQDPARLQQIVLLTDGQVGNEDELFDLLQQKLGTRRFFTIGIGSAPNSHLMRKAAELGRGTFTYVGNVNEVKDKMDGLFRKLERPVLHNVKLDATGWTDVQTYPSTIGDLYEGEPVVFAVRAGAVPSHATLQGQLGARAWSTPVPIADASFRSGLSVYWARKKITALMDGAFTGSPEEEIRKAVVEVALGHHLVSKYTSLVAVDVTPARPTDKPLQERTLGTNVAHGQDYQAIMGLPATATPAPLHILIGAGSLMLAWRLWLTRRRRPDWNAYRCPHIS